MTATIEYSDQRELETKLISAVSALGYTVLKTDTMHWESYEEMRIRFGYPKGSPTLSQKLARYTQEFPAQRGPSGRLRLLVVTPDLAKHLTKKNKPK
jgi:hypothetical protein